MRTLVLEGLIMLNIVDTRADIAVGNLACTTVLLVAPVMFLISPDFAATVVAGVW
jgi:hypothetical protein